MRYFPFSGELGLYQSVPNGASLKPKVRSREFTPFLCIRPRMPPSICALMRHRGDQTHVWPKKAWRFSSLRSISPQEAEAFDQVKALVVGFGVVDPVVPCSSATLSQTWHQDTGASVCAPSPTASLRLRILVFLLDHPCDRYVARTPL